MNPYPWFLLLLLLAPTLGGCAANDEGELTGSYAIARDDAGLDADMDAGDTESDIPEDLTADQFASTLSTTLCTALFDSCCPSGLNPGTALSDPSTCQSTAAGLEVALADPDTLSEVAYDQDQARACLTSLLAVEPADLCGDFDSIAALPSPERPWFDLPGFASCAQTLSGTAIDGTDCNTDLTCAPGLACINGMCTTQPAVGTDCSNNLECGDGRFGLACIGETCEALSATGQNCTDGTTCASGGCDGTSCVEGIPAALCQP